jgi:hypothetical protein
MNNAGLIIPKAFRLFGIIFSIETNQSSGQPINPGLKPGMYLLLVDDKKIEKLIVK